MALPDYAIVVGIKTYPNLGPGDTPANLEGSERGASEVYKWLTTEGGLKPENVRLIPRNIPAPPPPPGSIPQPTILDIEAAMAWLDGLARDQIGQDKGDLIGRRLYIYMSGHGFSPRVQQGCLYTANAKARQTYNIDATAWLKWFQDAGYFREFVLWMDCCMDRVNTMPAGDPNLALTLSDRPPGPSFVAFAAQRPLRAAEVNNPASGQMEGAFTWALLDGLRGAAADPNGRVTGRSLADWLRQSVRARLPDAALKDFDIAKEPEIVSESADLIFARELTPKTFKIRFKSAAMPPSGKLVVWAGSPLRAEYEKAINGRAVTLDLPAGLYYAEIADAGLGTAFEVVRDCDVNLITAARKLQTTDRTKLYSFNYNPTDAAVEISIVDRTLAAVERGVGELATKLPAGVFKLRTRTGRTVEDQVILLDRDMAKLADQFPAPHRASVAPIMGNVGSHEYQAGAVDDLVRRSEFERMKEKKPSSISLMVRTFSDGGKGVEALEPWHGISIIDQHKKPVLKAPDFDLHVVAEQDPFALAAKGVPPGDYTLLHEMADGATLAQSLIVPTGWALEVHVLRRVITTPDGMVFDQRPRISIHMMRVGAPPPSEDERQRIEAARTALTDERLILGTDLQNLLVRKFDNPIAGILGAHLMILGEEAGQIFEPGLLNEVVSNLHGLVGDDHPDVQAVSLRCTKKDLRTMSGRIARVPMFERSWQLLVQASYVDSRLLSGRLVKRLLTPTAFPPFLAWPHDSDSRNEAFKALREAVWAPQLIAVERRTPAGTLALPNALESLGPPGFALAPTKRPLSREARADRKLARTRAQNLNLPAAAFSRLI